ncbi:MAG: LLM class F420-dependent oxidoreductase [Halieaceae bacterium]|jgi:F420-dependent oxidoreductase-like protein|nr:LLM class F420-dependent oxidoreductase [Halieaceae bacterium]MDG1932707.1 LLM class F420-dependent oxidoreductase [Luminiphilus sp.]MDG2037556.1 LLM class F420-dependent oxidoreductase [Luminiphilus sp.]RZO78957.1 MAG: LLM class F420-dependent oxidoreductase [Halieaceae bacterium]|tara:strand:+ start:1702 stop:2739 length:1038 start_codon:yes stop_codon:yes gene_type:complete
MKLGFLLGYSGKQIHIPIDLIKQAESMGYDSVWTAEAYGNDAVTSAAWVLAHTSKIRVGTAIMQMPARTPAMCAMTAMSLDQLSEGRFIVGLGASGPQVVEGWHGVPYGKPVTRTKEYIQIMRKIFEREGPVEFDGQMYQMPNQSEGTTGLGKPLKSILAATDIPIYTASITPAGLRCAGEVADGVFPVWMDPNKYSVLGDSIGQGFEKAGGGKGLDNFDVAPFVTVAMNDDLNAAYDALRPWLALYIGGMGAKNKNFYHEYATRLGYGDAADQIQTLYLSGKKPEAEALVPNELLDEVSLIGPRERIIERLGPWKEAGKRGEVGSMLLGVQDPVVLELLASEML